MEAKNPTGKEAAEFASENRCEEGLIQGKKDKRQCFCPVDKAQEHVTDSSSRCGEIAKFIEAEKGSGSDQLETDHELRRCESLRTQAEQCCTNPASCMKRGDLVEPESPRPGEAIHKYCKRMRDAGDPNKNSNANAAAVCTSAYSKCQSECQKAAHRYDGSYAAPKLREIVQSCAGMQSQAQLLGGQGLESGAASFGGHLCSEESISMDELQRREAERVQTRARRENEDSTPPTESEGFFGGLARYLDLNPTTQKPKSDSSPALAPTPAPTAPRAAAPVHRPSAQPTGRFEPESSGATSHLSAARARNPGKTVFPGQQFYRPPAGMAVYEPASASAGPTGMRPSAVTSLARVGSVATSPGQVAKEGKQKGSASAVQAGGVGGFAAMSNRAPASHTVHAFPDRAAGAAPLSRDADIHGRHTNIFDVVSDIMNEKCSAGELFDCR